MAWGNSSNVNTANLDAGTDSPSLARADLYDALLELQNVIDGRDTADGVAGLDSDSLLSSTQMPSEINTKSGDDLTLDPSTDKVKIEHILNLNPQTVAQLEGRTDVQQGDIAFCSNGDAGAECLAVAVGEDDSAGNPTWKIVSIGAAIASS